jgi:hypothetical protein
VSAVLTFPDVASRRRATAWTPARIGARMLAVGLAAIALCWAALVNGQPFIHPDTVGYVRGADVAVMKLLGERFATPWALQAPPDVRVHQPAPSAKAAARSYDDQEVMGGRSIYYGALAALGERAGGFWLTVFIQALAVALLVEILLRALAVTGLVAYAGVMALLTLGSSAPFFAGFLMPDIWAGAAIAAAAALFALPGRLTRFDVAALSLIAAFAAMAHATVAPVLGGLLIAGGGVWLVRSRAAPAPWLGAGACVAAMLAAALGGWAFNLAVIHTAGKPPISPPFLTARVVADGPGTRFARERCAAQPFMVCRFAARLPLDVDHFLWGTTARDGVFLPASAAERRALGDEQTRFALAAVRAYPLDQIRASLRNAGLQLITTDLSDFGYKPSLRATLDSELPPAPLARFRRTFAYAQALPLGALWALQSAVLAASLALIGWIAARPIPAAPQARAERTAALVFAGLVILGVVANGVLCGVLSTLYGRYQARVVWTLPLAAAALGLVRWRPART